MYVKYEPAKSVGNYSTAETTYHTADREYAHGHGIQFLNRIIRNVLSVPILIHIFHKILYILQKNMCSELADKIKDRKFIVSKNYLFPLRDVPLQAR